jgi:uncharacterized protein YutE (UPF0331/DUF86 family)
MDEQIQAKIEDIEEYFSRLEEVAESSKGTMREEALENLTRKIVSAAIDIASRTVALEGKGRPDTYAGYFEKLSDLDIIDRELSESLEDMAKFRNFIVHNYGKIDVEELERIIEEDLDDVNEFNSEIYSYFSEEEQ